MNKLEQEMAALEAECCPDCNGSGSKDDSEIGDITFNTWTCPTCNGSGKKPENTDGHEKVDTTSNIAA